MKLSTLSMVSGAIGLALTVAMMAGCGGDDHHWHSYPQYKDLTLILCVKTPDHKPVGGAKVVVDGITDENRTDSQFHPLGDGYPDAWQGWLANWTSDAYQAVIDHRGDSTTFDIVVQKPGWTSDSTTVTIADDEPDHIFIRDTMIMEPQAAPDQLKRAPHKAEVLGAPAGLKFQRSGKPIHIIGAANGTAGGSK